MKNNGILLLIRPSIKLTMGTKSLANVAPQIAPFCDWGWPRLSPSRMDRRAPGHKTLWHIAQRKNHNCTLPGCDARAGHTPRPHGVGGGPS